MFLNEIRFLDSYNFFPKSLSQLIQVQINDDFNSLSPEADWAGGQGGNCPLGWSVLSRFGPVVFFLRTKVQST